MTYNYTQIYQFKNLNFQYDIYSFGLFTKHFNIGFVVTFTDWTSQHKNLNTLIFYL